MTLARLSERSDGMKITVKVTFTASKATVEVTVVPP